MIDEAPKTVYWLDNALYLNMTNQCSNSCYFCLKRTNAASAASTLSSQKNQPLQKSHLS
jgi:2-iminoacetate synthase ThiH